MMCFFLILVSHRSWLQEKSPIWMVLSSVLFWKRKIHQLTIKGIDLKTAWWKREAETQREGELPLRGGDWDVQQSLCRSGDVLWPAAGTDRLPYTSAAFIRCREYLRSAAPGGILPAGGPPITSRVQPYRTFVKNYMQSSKGKKKSREVNGGFLFLFILN